MSDERTLERFPTVNEQEFRRILEEKDSKNTRRSTNNAVKIFREYLSVRNLPETFENYSNEVLDDILSKFYVEVRQENGEKYQKSSLYSIRYGLNRHLSLTRNVDIIKDSVFQVSQKLFKAVTIDLKRDGKGAITHYPPIEDSDLKKMYDYFDTENNVKLQQKVFVDIMLYFGRRGRENIHELKVSDFAATTDSDGQIFIYLSKDEQTKNHQDDPNSADGRMYAKSDDPMCPVKSFMKYKRSLNPKCNRLFQRPNKGENHVNWYNNAPLGHNSIGDMMPTISSMAGLSKRYTNHSLRSSTVHILDRNDFAGRHITSVTGHKAESSLKTYTGYTAPNIKRKMSDTISDSLRRVKETKVQSKDENKENEVNLLNTELVPLSNSQYDNLVTDLNNDDTDLDEIVQTFDTTKMRNTILLVSSFCILPDHVTFQCQFSMDVQI